MWGQRLVSACRGQGWYTASCYAVPRVFPHMNSLTILCPGQEEVVNLRGSVKDSDFRSWEKSQRMWTWRKWLIRIFVGRLWNDVCFYKCVSDQEIHLDNILLSCLKNIKPWTAYHELSSCIKTSYFRLKMILIDDICLWGCCFLLHNMEAFRVIIFSLTALVLLRHEQTQTATGSQKCHGARQALHWLMEKEKCKADSSSPSDNITMIF